MAVMRLQVLATIWYSGIFAVNTRETPRWPDNFPVPAEVFGFQSKFVDLSDGLRIHYVERTSSRNSAGKEPFVLVHGWPDSWMSFQRMLPLLGLDRRILALDQRGFGLSSHPAGEYDPMMFAHDLKEWLDVLAVHGKICLLGHSMGSFISWHFAGLWPDRVQHLFLVGTARTGDNPVLGSVATQVNALNNISYDFVRDFQYSTFFDISTAGNWFPPQTVYESMKAPLFVWQTCIESLVSLPLSVSADLVPRIKASTVLVRGEADVLFTDEDQQAMLALQPSWTLITVKNASHSVQWEEEGARALTAIILKKLDPDSSPSLDEEFTSSSKDRFATSASFRKGLVRVSVAVATVVCMVTFIFKGRSQAPAPPVYLGYVQA